jgi:hypothetical protein
MQYTFPTTEDSFLNAKNLLNHLTTVLQTKKWLHTEHGQVEDMIHKDGFKILHLLFQGHLDERTKVEADLSKETMDRSGSLYTRTDCCRQLNCIFGKVEVQRKGYSDNGRDSVFPQDAELNISKDSYSDGLRVKAAEFVSDLSFEKSTLNILKCTASSVPKYQIENVIQNMSQDFDTFYKTREVTDASDSSILVLTCDGKGIVMRQSDLRSSTQKAAKLEQHKKQTRLSKDEKRNRQVR